MRVVLADIDQSALNKTENDLRSVGADVLAILTDVSKPDDVETLAQKTLYHFGNVHLLFNNAGVATGSTIWDSTLDDWEWVVGVNMWGVIHGLRVFVPIMIDQDTECHIVNTASVVGLLDKFSSSSYQVTKHAVVAISEQLYHSLVEMESKVKASEHVFRAIRQDKFYILVNADEYKTLIRMRMENILEESNPTESDT